MLGRSSRNTTNFDRATNGELSHAPHDIHRNLAAPGRVPMIHCQLATLVSHCKPGLIPAQPECGAAGRMKETCLFTVVAILGVTLGSCASQSVWRSAEPSNHAQELSRIAASIERDDAQCRGSGLALGSRAYRECRTRLANARER
jgi:hypothetical protein